MSDTIRVITTCTHRKAIVPAPALANALPGLAAPQPRLPAERLYVGEQHRRLMQGVDCLRATRRVDVWVISADAGIVSGDAELEPYDTSFTGLTPDELRRRADQMGIPDAIRGVLGVPAALTVVLAGNEYFDAAQLDAPVAWAAPTLVLASSSRADRLVPHPNLRVAAISQATAKTWSLPLTLLKGEIARRLLVAIADGLDPAAPFANGTNHLSELLDPGGELAVC